MEDQISFKICKFLAFGIFQYKPVKNILLAMKVFLASSLLVQGFLFLKKFELTYFIQYGPLYFCTFYSTACFILQPLVENLIRDHLQNVQIWKSDEASVEIRKKYSTTCFWIVVYMITLIFVAIISAISITFCISTKDITNLMYIFKLNEMFFGKWAKYMIWVLKPFSVVLFLMSVGTPAFNIFYFCCVVDFQKKILHHHIQDLNCDCDVNDINTEYHEIITKKLSFYVKRHSEFNKCICRLFRKLTGFVFLYKIFGTICLAGIVVLYFRFEGSLSQQYLCIVGLLGCGLLTLAAFAAGGQILEDFVGGKVVLTNFLSKSVDLVAELNEIRWYHWSQRNKKTYVLLLMNTAPKLKIKCSENFSLNYQLALEVMKAVFSFISVLYTLQRN